jgi:hypothetical protein
VAQFKIKMNNATLKSNPLFSWRLKRASKVNPINALLNTDSTKGNPSEDVASIITSFIALIAALAGIVAFVYVTGKSQEFSESGNNGAKSLNNSAVAVLDTHHVCIPPINGALTLTLPSSASLDLGRYVSASLPISIPPEAATDSRTAFVTWTNGTSSFSYKIGQNKGALFIVALELGSRKWKLIREWPSDNGYTAGS